MLLEKCEIWYPKLDPERPNAKFSRDNPTWELQLRTKNKEQKKQWEAANLIVKAVMPDVGDPYWRVNLKKKSIAKGGKAANPVSVVDGNLAPVDPLTIGNGSVANIRVFQYEYTKTDGSGKGLATILMGLQLVKHVRYVPKKRDDDFKRTHTETVAPEEPEDDGEADAEAEADKPAF